MAKKVAIIGAGVSGLTAIKCCMDENLDPVCFERTGDIGGLWNFTEAVRDGQACVARSTIIDTSKEMMCFSDYPIPKEYPSYMHNKLIMKYFRQYADHFGLIKHIRFHTAVGILELQTRIDHSKFTPRLGMYVMAYYAH